MKNEIVRLRPLFETLSHELLNQAGTISFALQIIAADAEQSTTGATEFAIPIKTALKNTNDLIRTLKVFADWIDAMSTTPPTKGALDELARALISAHFSRYGNPQQTLEWKTVGSDGTIICAQSAEEGLFDFSRSGLALTLLTELFPDGQVTTIDKDSGIVVNVGSSSYI